jgi:hypothetical protein
LPNEVVQPGRELVQMQDLQTGAKLLEIAREMDNALREAQVLESQATVQGLSHDRWQELQSSASQQRALWANKRKELDSWLEHGFEGKHGDDHGNGVYFVRAPAFTAEDRLKVTEPRWTVLNSQFHQELTGRTVQPTEPLLRLGAKSGPWEIELKIPQKHIGQVLKAFEREHTDTLVVDFLLRSDTTQTFKGILTRDKIAGEATPAHDEAGEAEPVVVAKVRLDGDDIPPDYRLTRDSPLLLSGTEVHAKIRCGKRAMGYSLFYGVWEFVCDKVLFFF